MKEINRVKKYREFKEIFNHKKFKRNEIYTIYYQKNDVGFTRVGIHVSKKNGIAVKRVKIKRQVRAILDKYLEYQKHQLNLIVVISPKYNTDEFQKNEKLLYDLLKQITSIKEK